MKYDILCVGEINVDLILAGINRIPAFGEEVLATGIGQHAGGCTANVAAFAAQLGMKTALCARVGRDDFGDFLIEQMEQAGVSTEFIIRDDNLQTGITVSLSGSQDRAFVTYLGTIDSLTEADVPDEILQQGRHIHIGSYFLQKKLQPDISKIFNRARNLGITTSLDTGYDPYEQWDAGIGQALGSVDLFMPNEVEAMATGKAQTPLEGAYNLAQKAREVTLKLGSEDFVHLQASQRTMAQGFKVDVVDTTCCGDAFNAGYLTARLEGKQVADCLAWGNATGALIAGGSGACIERLSREAVVALIQGR